MPFKLILTLVNVTSCYWSLFKYAQYFAKRHPKVIEDEKAVEVVMRLEEEIPSSKANEKWSGGDAQDDGEGGRRMFLTPLTARERDPDSQQGISPATTESSTSTTPQRLSFVLGDNECLSPGPEQPEPAFMEQQKVQATDFGSPELPTATHRGASLFHSASRRLGRRRASWSESPV